jgi:hypothetical protein
MRSTPTTALGNGTLSADWHQLIEDIKDDPDARALLKQALDSQTQAGRARPVNNNSIAPETDYWFSLIDTRAAAAFLSMSPRRLEGLRYHGGSPRWHQISPRCVRYRRADLRDWAEARSSHNTSQRTQGLDKFGRGGE